MIKWIKAMLNERKVVRRTAMFWAMGLITYTIVMFYENIALIFGPQATVIVSVIGILATATAFMIKMREMDDRDDI